MESWKSVVGYEGHYEVSCLGNVRSVERVLPHPHSGHRTIKARVLKLQWTEKHPRPRVTLYKESSRRILQVQHLVLEAFTGPRLDRIACHLDDIPTNNTVENLYWGTPSSNQYDRVRNGKDPNSQKTQCPQGHLYSEENLLKTTNKRRACKVCHRAKQKRYLTKKAGRNYDES